MLRSLHQDVVGELGKVLWVLMGSIGVVLLIACANVANLLLVRAEGRQQELAIRLAMGASAGRIAGGTAARKRAARHPRRRRRTGPGVGRACACWSRSRPTTCRGWIISASMRRWCCSPSPSPLAAGLLFGLIPVLKYAAPNVTAALRAGGRTLSQSRERHRARNTLVVVQTALAVVLLIGSGLMIRTFQALRQVDPGFRAPGTADTVALHTRKRHQRIPDRPFAHSRRSRANSLQFRA